jgi:hypothetical protein
MKRGVVGAFHKVSKKYLPLYVAEFQFGYNNRENNDIFGTAISDADKQLGISHGSGRGFSPSFFPSRFVFVVWFGVDSMA